MIPLTLTEIAHVVDGEVVGDGSTHVTGAATLDSRAVEPGGLFVALAGEHVDGHDYAARAVEAGAAAILGSRDVGVPGVVVDDAAVALGRLARHVLDVVRPGVVALTGSQGKTSVKDMIAQLVGPQRRVVATQGNHNNELGVPLTVLRADHDTEVLVVEMGARGIGHVAELCRIAPPDVSVVLNVGTAHVGEFGSVDNIAIGKGELVEALRPGGTAVLNADDHRVAAMQGRTEAVVRWFGRDVEPGSDGVRVVEVRPTASGEPDATYAVRDRVDTVHVPLVGEHQAVNLAAALAVCEVLGLGADEVLATVPALRSASTGRMERHVTPDGVVVLDDTYNANPESVRAGLSALAALEAPRRVAVLGEMLELGDGSLEAHRSVGEHAASLGVDLVVVVGEPARAIAEGAGEVATVAPDVDAAVEVLRPWLQRGDAVLVKASRGARLERVVHALTGA